MGWLTRAGGYTMNCVAERGPYFERMLNMANVVSKKRRMALVAIACVCALVVGAPAAYALWYVHGDDHVADTGGTGVLEITCTLDATAVGEGVKTDVIFVPNGSSAADVLDEMIVSSESQNGLEAIHDYSYTSLKDYLSGKTYSITVHNAESQDPGTQTTHDSEGASGEDVALQRWDNVVVTVEG